MKHFYQLSLAAILFFGLLSFSNKLKAQITLAAGDIAFIGYQTNVSPAGDGFSFITLKDMPANTLLYFTERGWGGTTWVTGSTEPHLLWTVPAFTPAGTIVSVVETTTPDTFTITGTTGTSFTMVKGSGFNLSGGDQILAYQSASGAEPAMPTFIAGIHGDYNSSDYDGGTTWNTTWDGTNGATGGNESALPQGLTNGGNCISLFPFPGPEVANNKYIGSLTGTVTALLTSINNPANWTNHTTNDLGITPSGYATPSITSSTATVTSIVRANSSPSNANNVTYTITFSSAVSGFTISKLSLTTTGLSGASINSLSTSDNINYTVTVNTGVGSGTIRLDLASSTGITPSISNVPYVAGEVYTIDKTAPTVSGVTSSTANGSYKTSAVISIQVNFSENVTVTGTPQLTLETGATDRVVNYAGGSGTSTLTFNYTVQSGDSNSDLDYVATSSLALNAGTIKDAVGNIATLTLPSPGTAGSLGANKNLVIDGVFPTVVGVTSSTANGSYKVSDVIPIQVNFSENVTVTGTPQLTLETGTTDRVVNYAVGSGTSTLTFNYTVQAGDVSTDLDYVSTSSLALNGGTIKDVAGNNATLTLPSLGAAGSLSANKNLVIDGVAPTLSITSNKSSLKIGETATITFSFSEAVNNFNIGNITISGGTLGNFSGSGSVYTATFTPSDGVNNGTASITVAASAYTDIAGNNGAAGGSPSVTFDTKAPSVIISSSSGSSTGNSPIPFTVTFSENITGFNLTKTTVSNGIASNLSGTGAIYTFMVTPTANGNVTVDIAADLVQDMAGNNNTAAAQIVINYQSSLPVNLISFTVKAENNYAKLIWQTASEQNNKIFELYRSGDDSKPVKIGEVKGNGTTTLENNYNFYDKQPLKGNNYYSLVQVDHDGKQTTIGEQVLNFSFSGFNLSIYPNPTQNHITVDYQKGTYDTLSIFGVDGKLLQTIKLKSSQEFAQIDLTAYPIGIYFIKAIGKLGNATHKIIKQ